MEDQHDDLATLRAEIDRIDESVAELILERVRIAEEVATVKAASGKDIVDERREADVKARYERRFRREGVDPENGRALAECLIEIAIDREAEIDDAS